MTFDELNRHLDLLRELQKAQERLERLCLKAYPGAQNLDGMPHGSGVRDKVGELAVEIAEYRAEVDALKAQVRASGRRVEKFVRSVPDKDVRLILRLRFQRGFQWKEIADYCGKFTTEASVKVAVYQYFRDNTE